jgi:methylase of polypeptide subunit release factors
VVQDATRSRRLARVIFGVDFLFPLDSGESYFDVTTPVLARVAAAHVRPSWRVVDVGTGTVAAIALHLWHKVGCEVVATEVDLQIAARADENIALNRAPVQLVRGSFLDGVEGRIDAVVFNPPYVATETGERRRLPDRLRSQWDGGPDGCRVIRDFLDVMASEPRRPLVFLGVNRTHVPAPRLAALLDARPSIASEGVHRARLLPVDVYVLQKR